MKKLLLLVSLMTAVALIMACGKTKEDPHAGHNHAGHDHGSHSHAMDMGNTKVVMAESYQLAFDLMDRKAHHHMAEMMKLDPAKMEKKFAKESNRVIALTVMKKPENKLIKDAKVSLTVTDPAGKTTPLTTHVMEGAGMFHYGADFAMKAKGDYKVDAAITTGEKQVKATTSFTLK